MKCCICRKGPAEGVSVYRINAKRQPDPRRTCDWQFWRDDYDGAPDAGVTRSGSAPSVDDCKAQIDDQIADEAAQPGLTRAEQIAKAARCGCRGSDPDWCACQNTPDSETVAARVAALYPTVSTPTGEAPS